MLHGSCKALFKKNCWNTLGSHTEHLSKMSHPSRHVFNNMLPGSGVLGKQEHGDMLGESGCLWDKSYTLPVLFWWPQDTRVNTEAQWGSLAVGSKFHWEGPIWNMQEAFRRHSHWAVRTDWNTLNIRVRWNLYNILAMLLKKKTLANTTVVCCFDI